jgi:mono/diheme cytochrome c family protein
MRRASYVVAAVAMVGAAALAVAQAGGGQATGGGRMGRDLEKLDLPLDRWQAKRLPTLPQGVTLDMIRAGDSLYRGKGGCVTCHGDDAFGMANAGSGLTMGLNFIPGQITDIDSVITAGIPENLTRSSVAMPPRGVGGNLTPEESHHIAAYVWAIARVHAEPWPGGHRTHKAGAAGDTARPAGTE